METYDPAEGEATKLAVESVVEDWAAVTQRVLFGYPAFYAGRTIFVLIANDGLALTRLPEDDRERLAESHDVGPFQAGGQAIEKWTYVPVGPAGVDALVPFLRASYQAARTESRPVPPPDEQ
jgi:hypothetical protein